MHNIGKYKHKNYNNREQILNASGILTIDGPYKNIYENRDIFKNKQCILFIIGNWIGGDNSLDKGVPYEKMCNWEEIRELEKMGMDLGWHTQNHRDLTKLSHEEVIKEITPPENFSRRYLAYPYGKFNQTVLDAVMEVGYDFAFSVNKGDNSDYQIKRQYLR